MFQKIFIYVLCLFFVASFSWSQESIQEKVDNMLKNSYVPDQILIKFKENVSELQKRQILGYVFQIRFMCDIDQVNWVKSITLGNEEDTSVRLYSINTRGQSLKTALEKILSSEDVEYAEPNHIYTICKTPNDANWSQQWDKRKIFCPSAWNTSTDASSILAAILDTGVKYDHEDLGTNMWKNTGETDGNDIDDDGNGYIDDYYGATFIDGTGTQTDAPPMDVEGHGTHCAGIVGAVGDNSSGIAGVCWNAKIVAVKVLKNDGTGNALDIAKGIDYAVKVGAKVINMSFSSTAKNTTLETAIKNARTKGVIVVCAAGNGTGDGTNNDAKPYYPANYALDNIVVVGATDGYDIKWTKSNYGKTTVDLFAPGKDVYSTTVDGSYNTLSGTSMAAAQVTGGLALVWATYPQFGYTQVIRHMYNTVDKLDPLTNYCATGGRLNVTTSLTTPSVIAGFGINKGGVSVYRYADEFSPTRETTNLPQHKTSAKPEKVLPLFKKVLVESESQTEIESTQPVTEPENIEVSTTDSRGISWDLLTNSTGKAIAMVDLINSEYPQAVVSTGTEVYIHSVFERKVLYKIVPGGTISKILPVDWKDADETTTQYKDIILSGNQGIWLWRQQPTVKLTKIYSGNVVSVGYIKQSSKRPISYPVRIIFSVSGKGVYEYLMNASTNKSSLWQLHSLNATSMAPIKASSTVTNLVAAFPGYGIYTYDAESDNGTWNYEDTAYPTILAAANVDNSTTEDELLAYFPYDNGFYARMGTEWKAITSNKPVAIYPTNINYDDKEEIVVGFETPTKHIVILEYFNDERDPYWSTYGLETKAFESLDAWRKVAKK